MDIYECEHNGFDSTITEKVYLDFNATTPLEKQVIESINECLVNGWYNPSGQYQKCKEAKNLINRSRKQVANMINAPSSDIIFTSGGTEANNLVFHSVLKYYEKLRKRFSSYKQPHMIISKIEHDSVKLIAENYENEKLAEITQISVDQSGKFNVEEVIASIKPNTILISIMLANNETGVIQPIKELMQEIKKLNLNKFDSKSERMCPLFMHTDAAQAIGKVKVDVDELQVDYLTIVGHKFYGPRIGALYAKNCLSQLDEESFHYEINKISPIFHNYFGASQENGLRPGTENTPMIVGIGKASELVSKNLEKYSNNMKETRNYLEQRLVEVFGIDKLQFNGGSSKRLPNTCNVSFLHSQKLKGFAVLNNAKLLEASTGACCHSGKLKASNVLLAMGINELVASNAIRLSTGRETTKTQIDLIVEDLRQSINSII